MTLLILSPEYASHYAPLAEIGRAARRRGADVVIATGPTLAGRADGEGFGWLPLVLGPGRNDGRCPPEDPELERFFAATRAGMVPTLVHQARLRQRDLLWEPDRVVSDVARLLDEVRPDTVLVDQVSLASTLAMIASGRRFATFVPGHPCQLPVGEERYGLPRRWPSAFDPSPEDVAALRGVCDVAGDQANEVFHRVLTGVGREAPQDAFSAHGDTVVYPWPADFHHPERLPLLPPHVSSGPLVRAESLSAGNEVWLGQHSEAPLVYVALGTFISLRADVLRTLASGLARLPVRVALATGGTERSTLGEMPEHWLVDDVLAQVALLAHADVAVSHAGGGSVGEAMALGVPQLVLPFSTDQFATAAEVERLGIGLAADPNALTAPAAGDLVARLLDEPAFASSAARHRVSDRTAAADIAADAVLAQPV